MQSLSHGEGIPIGNAPVYPYCGTGSVQAIEFNDVPDANGGTIVDNIASNHINGDQPETSTKMPLSDVSAALFRLSPNSDLPLGRTVGVSGPTHSICKEIPLWYRLLFSELINGRAPSPAYPPHQSQPVTESCQHSLINRLPMFPVSVSGFCSQTDTSHSNSVGLPSHLAHTAPVSTRASPPSDVSRDLKASPTTEPIFRVSSKFSPSSQTVHVSALGPSHPGSFYKHHNPFPSSIYTQPSPDCVRHVRSDGASQGSSVKLISDSGSVEVPPDESSLTATNLPTLQPASRFRKARIHETVEQWSCGRTSVHDCRLKAIPDWVSELQKKTLVMGQDVVAAIEQLVNDLSRGQLRATDRNLKNAATSLISSVSKFSDAPEGAGHRQHLPPSGKTALSLERSRAPEGINLFSFWDGGCRVACQVTRPVDARSQQKDQSCLESVCSNCADSLSGGGSNVCKRYPYCTKLIDSRSCTVRQPFHFQEESLVHMDKDTVASRDSEVTTLSHNSPVPTVLPSSALVDPATAYLRRHRLERQHHLGHLPAATVVSVRQGDIPSGNEFSAPLSTSCHLKTEPVDFTSLNVPTHTSHQINPTNTDPLKCLQAILPSGGTVDGMAPPTSPALFDDKGSLFIQLTPSSSSPIQKIDVSHCPLQNAMPGDPDACTNVSPQFDQLDHSIPVSFQADEDTVYRRLRNGSGSYHNVSQTECNSRDYGVDPRNHLLAQPLSSPPSPNVSLRYGSVTHQVERDNLVHDNTEPLRNGPFSDRASFMWPLVVKVPGHSPGKTDSQAIPQRPSKLLSWRACRGYGSGKSSSAGSNRLDARIADSMNVIRGAIENAFQNELAAAHAENIGLLSEIDRLKAEVDSLRSFQAAFYALRPFVPSDIWEGLIAKKSPVGTCSDELAPDSLPNYCANTSVPQIPGDLSGSTLQRHT